MISSLRRVDGVDRVSLSSSEKLAGDTGVQQGHRRQRRRHYGDCRNGIKRFPQFSMTLFFQQPSATTGAQPKSTTTP